MIADCVQSSLIPTDTVALWRAATLDCLAQLLGTANITLGHVEELLEAQSRKLMLPILRAAAQAMAAQQLFVCPVCGKPLAMEAKKRPRTLDSVFGALGFKRDYGWCPKCKQYFHPADHAMGLAPGAAATPRVQEIAARLSARSPYAQASKDASRLTGVSVNPSTLHREALRQADKAIQCREADVALSKTLEGAAQLSARSQTASLNPFTLIIEIDAWNIRERDDWGATDTLRAKGIEPERWHWVYTATVFRLDQRTQTQSGRPAITQRKYVATRQGLDEFTHQLYAEALSCGLLNAKEVLVIADGAIWIWNLAQSRFKEAKQRVDLYHVKEHLHELARALHPQDAQAREQWLAPLLRYLESRNDGALDVLCELKDVSLKLNNLTSAQHEAIDREIGYFTTHHKRMDYKRGKAAGEPVGSGAVESTARQYQTRFKCTGQYWTLAGDESLLALATLDRNDRWHRLYPHIPAQSSGPQN